jgi:hypothetical protein
MLAFSFFNIIFHKNIEHNYNKRDSKHIFENATISITFCSLRIKPIVVGVAILSGIMMSVVMENVQAPLVPGDLLKTFDNIRYQIKTTPITKTEIKKRRNTEKINTFPLSLVKFSTYTLFG